MSSGYHMVVCAGIVPDPLQALEPIETPSGPALKNEMLLPAVLDPWAGHALYEAANLAAHNSGSKVWLVSLGAKAKLQQVMMTVAQKVPFELVALDGPASGFSDSFGTAADGAGNRSAARLFERRNVSKRPAVGQHGGGFARRRLGGRAQSGAAGGDRFGPEAGLRRARLALVEG